VGTPSLFTTAAAATAAVIRNATLLDVFVVFKGRLRSFIGPGSSPTSSKICR
jgi:hypothetical protein